MREARLVSHRRARRRHVRCRERAPVVSRERRGKALHRVRRVPRAWGCGAVWLGNAVSPLAAVERYRRLGERFGLLLDGGLCNRSSVPRFCSFSTSRHGGFGLLWKYPGAFGLRLGWLRGRGSLVHGRLRGRRSLCVRWMNNRRSAWRRPGLLLYFLTGGFPRHGAPSRHGGPGLRSGGSLGGLGRLPSRRTTACRLVTRGNTSSRSLRPRPGWLLRPNRRRGCLRNHIRPLDLRVAGWVVPLSVLRGLSLSRPRALQLGLPSGRLRPRTL